MVPAGRAVHMVGFDQQVADVAATLGALILVVPLARGAMKEIIAGRPSSDSLACLAVLAAIALYHAQAGTMATGEQQLVTVCQCNTFLDPYPSGQSAQWR